MSKRKKPARDVEAPSSPEDAVVAADVAVVEPEPPRVVEEAPPPARGRAKKKAAAAPELEAFARTRGKRKGKAPDEEAPAVEPTAEPAPEHANGVAEHTDDDGEPELAAPDTAAPPDSEPPPHATTPFDALGINDLDVEMTVNISGDLMDLPGRDDLDEPTIDIAGEQLGDVDKVIDQRRHLRGCLEALIFASDTPLRPKEMAGLADTPLKAVLEALEELRTEYATRGLHLEEVAGGWVFRTSPEYSAAIRDLRKERPVRLSRAQVETLAIIAYRQPVTRPEVDDVRGVDSGPVLKLLLERDLVRILGKRDEVGRPIIYGTTNTFLEFFGLNSLKDLPTLREFTELTEESREKYEEELGDMPAPPPPPEPPAPEPPRPSREEYEGDANLRADDDPTETSMRRSDTLVDQGELSNDVPEEAEETSEDEDDDGDDDDEDDDDDDDDDDEDDDDDDDDDDDEDDDEEDGDG